MRTLYTVIIKLKSVGWMYLKELTLLWVPAVCRWDTPRRQRTSWPSETEPRPPPAVRTATVRWRAAMRARPSRGRGRTAAAAWPQSCKRCLTRPWHFIFTLGCHYWSQRQFKVETTCWNSVECWFVKILSTFNKQIRGCSRGLFLSIK